MAIAGPAIDLTCMLACRCKDRLAGKRLHKGQKTVKKFQLTSHVISSKQCVPAKHGRSIKALKTFCCFEQKPADAGQNHVKCTACIYHISITLQAWLSMLAQVAEWQLARPPADNASRPNEAWVFFSFCTESAQRHGRNNSYQRGCRLCLLVERYRKSLV